MFCRVLEWGPFSKEVHKIVTWEANDEGDFVEMMAKFWKCCYF